MQTVTFKGRQFTISEKKPMSNFPGHASIVPSAEYIFFAEGKRGKSIMGYLFPDGSYQVLTPK